VQVATACAGTGQAWLQLPQWFGSLLVSTQVLPHWVWPGPQPLWQAPWTQFWPLGQLWPHVPQLLGSVWVLTRTPSQQVWPDTQQSVPLLPVHSVLSHGQTRQSPLLQYWPLGQQRPSQQLSPAWQQAERCVPEHRDVLVGQVVTQLPPAQCWSGRQQRLLAGSQQDQWAGQQPFAPLPQHSRCCSQQFPLGQQCWVPLQALAWPLGLSQQILPAQTQRVPPQQRPGQHWLLQQVVPAGQQRPLQSTRPGGQGEAASAECRPREASNAVARPPPRRRRASRRERPWARSRAS
jgi:hypothetical protein